MVEQEGGDRDQRLQRQVELAPNPPPQALGMTRTRPSGSPRTSASSSRSMYGVWVVAKTSTRSVDQARRPGLGLDIGVFDIGRLERPGRRRGGRGQVGVRVAEPDEALDEHVPGRGLVEPRRGRVQRGVDPDQRRQRLPFDRQLVVGDRGHGRRVADERQHGLAAVSDVALGENRLVLAGRVDPVPVVARDVGGGQDPDETRVAGADRREVADAEARMRVWRADRPQVPGAVGRQVVAEQLGAGDLGQPVGAGDARADRGADRRRGRPRRRRPTRSRERHRRSRRTRAPAEHAAEPVEDLGRRGLGVRAISSSAAISIPGVQRAALRAAAGEEGGLERGRAVGPGETLDRLDAPAVHLARRDEAGADLLPVEPHGARAAVAGVAADLGAGQAEVLAQDVHEAAPSVRAHLDAAHR